MLAADSFSFLIDSDFVSVALFAALFRVVGSPVGVGFAFRAAFGRFATAGVPLNAVRDAAPRANWPFRKLPGKSRCPTRANTVYLYILSYLGAKCGRVAQRDTPEIAICPHTGASQSKPPDVDKTQPKTTDNRGPPKGNTTSYDFLSHASRRAYQIQKAVGRRAKNRQNERAKRTPP